jgi:hypothetical protein
MSKEEDLSVNNTSSKEESDDDSTPEEPATLLNTNQLSRSDSREHSITLPLG